MVVCTISNIGVIGMCELTEESKNIVMNELEMIKAINYYINSYEISIAIYLKRKDDLKIEHQD